VGEEEGVVSVALVCCIAEELGEGGFTAILTHAEDAGSLSFERLGVGWFSAVGAIGCFFGSWRKWIRPCAEWGEEERGCFGSFGSFFWFVSLLQGNVRFVFLGATETKEGRKDLP